MLHYLGKTYETVLRSGIFYIYFVANVVHKRVGHTSEWANLNQPPHEDHKKTQPRR